MIALFGGRVTVGPAILADSQAVQDLVADQEFRNFVKYSDERFLQLEVERDDPTDRPNHDWIARHAWRRMLQPGWVSSSALGTEAMRRAAEVALSKDFNPDELERLTKQIDSLVASYSLEKSQRARDVLTGTFDLLGWFGVTQGAVAEMKSAQSATYYDRLITACNIEDSPNIDRNILRRVRRYVDEHVTDTSRRSHVLKALESDMSLDLRSKAEVRATVGSAWTSAMSDGSRATTGVTYPLSQGVLIPRIVDPGLEAIVNSIQAEGLIEIAPTTFDRLSLRFDLTKLTWRNVSDIVKETQGTRKRITDYVDYRVPLDPGVIRAHHQALNDAIRHRFPGASATEVAMFLLSMSSAVVFQNPFGLAASTLTAANLLARELRWTRGVFVATSLNRYSNQLTPPKTKRSPSPNTSEG